MIKGAAVFPIMIASPSDVQAYREKFFYTITLINSIFLEDKKAILHPLAWERHMAPSGSNSPQENIDRIILEASDIVVAVFWHRFGTPVGDDLSGTAGEIRRARAAGKAVLVYFSTEAWPQGADPEQIQKVKDYKTYCHVNQIGTKDVSSVDDFHSKLLFDLQATFQQDQTLKAALAGAGATEQMQQGIKELSSRAEVLKFRGITASGPGFVVDQPLVLREEEARKAQQGSHEISTAQRRNPDPPRRVLSDDAAQILTNKLVKNVSVTSSNFAAVYFDKASHDAPDYARQIMRAIKRAHAWDSEATENYQGPSVSGVQVCVRDINNPNKSALALETAFREAGIEIGWLAFPDMKPNEVHVYVGA